LRTAATGGGFCQMPDALVAARAGLHRWEEPCLSGENGAGTIFFSGCPLGCVFCQNGSISHQGYGTVISETRLYEIFEELAAQGAHCLELVTPTQFTHILARVLERPVPAGLPVVWNSGGYERADTLRMLEGKVDIYLPDLKYLSPDCAGRYSAAPDYPESATEAILEMYRQRGAVRFEGELLKSGVIIRHLLLPGGLPEAKRVMDWVAEQFPAGAVLFSLMAQYTPMGDLSRCPELNRTLRNSEVRAAKQYMENLGLSGYVQDLDAVGEGFIPSFDLTGL
jgi:putative pyruvate formate lyase activating enzyme